MIRTLAKPRLMLKNCKVMKIKEHLFTGIKLKFAHFIRTKTFLTFVKKTYYCSQKKHINI